MLLISRGARAEGGGPRWAPHPPPVRIELGPSGWAEVDPTVLLVKVAEGAPLQVDGGGLRIGGAGGPALEALLDGSTPVFPRDPAALEAERREALARGPAPDLRRWRRLRLPDARAAQDRARALLQHPGVETLAFARRPQPPPADLSPPTPDLEAAQGYRAAAPAGLSAAEGARWPGADGAGVLIADVEYDWTPGHEDLGAVVGAAPAWGWDPDLYAFHGTAVAGILAAGDNGFGVTGIAPGAAVLMVSPYEAPGEYNVAAAIDAAAALIGPGDVLLIEQQARFDGAYAPISVDPAVFDAIVVAVARGRVVVEPAGNGGQDLDHPRFGGRFDRAERDSGSVMVGGGVPPGYDWPARSWLPGGSCHGSRVDVQGWYLGVATTSDGAPGGPDPDLHWTGDPLQGYTSGFSGTSAAAPMVAGVAAALQGLRRARGLDPLDPLELRAALRATGAPAQGGALIGPQPDLRALLWTVGLR